jgi:hypothetical protein
MKNSLRRGLFHPDDIKTVDLGNSTAESPMSAPLPSMYKKPSRPPISPLLPTNPPSGPPSHSRSSSLVGSFGGTGSFGRSEAQRICGQEFDKYTEDGEENYEDVFGKVNNTS